MKYITILIAALFLGSCASIKNANEIRVSASTSGPMGLPSKGDHNFYTYNANVGVGNVDVGYGHSLLFGNSFSAGVAIPKTGLYISNTYYYNNPYNPSVNPWGNWVFVKKTIKIPIKKKN